MAKKKPQWVVHATHPTTYQNVVLRREGERGWLAMETLEEIGYIGVMISDADYYDGPNWEDPWSALRAKGEVAEVK